MSKLLFLYQAIKKNGGSAFQSERLVTELRRHFDIRLAFGIVPDSLYESYEQLAPGEYLSESAFEKANYDAVYIEGRLGVQSGTCSQRGYSATFKRYIEQGGVLVLEHRMAPDLTPTEGGIRGEGPPVVVINRFLQAVGFEPFLATDPGPYNLYANYQPSGRVEWGRGSDEQYDLPYGYLRIAVTAAYLDHIAPRFRRLYEGLDALIVHAPVGVGIWSEPILAGNPKSTRLLLESDVFHDGVTCPVFGSVRTRNGGAAALIAAEVASDRVVVEHGEAGVLFMARFVQALVEDQAARKHTDLPRIQPQSALIYEGVNVGHVLAAAPWKRLIEQGVADRDEAVRLRAHIQNDPESALMRMRKLVEKLVDHLLATHPTPSIPSVKKHGVREKRNRGRGHDLAAKIKEVERALPMPESVSTLLHSIREHGNRGVHGHVRESADAAVILPLLVRALNWFADEHLAGDSIPEAVSSDPSGDVAQPVE